MLRVEHLTKIHGNSEDHNSGGIRDASFALAQGTFFTLLGPSGCGKTTTLRCIAGLEAPDRGVIRVGGRSVFDANLRVNISADQRSIGMVFQSYAIWPHMTVAANVAFPLTVSKKHRFSRAETNDAVLRALSVVELNGYQDRLPTSLSGGEQQRVALARAIVHEPRLLLLDEPLSNLDAQLRDEMRTELKRLQNKIGITTLYVTHDQCEAIALSDQIAVINQGQIVQIGNPFEIYFQPTDTFVAEFVGGTNHLEGRLRSMIDGYGEVEVLNGRLLKCVIPHPISNPSAVSVFIRLESIRLLPRGEIIVKPGENCLLGRISCVTFLGPVYRIDVVIDGMILRATVPSDAFCANNNEVLLLFSSERTVVVSRSTSWREPIREG